MRDCPAQVALRLLSVGLTAFLSPTVAWAGQDTPPTTEPSYPIVSIGVCAHAGRADVGEGRSMLVRQVDRAVREPERDRVEREVSVGNLLREDHVVIAVFADHQS